MNKEIIKIDVEDWNIINNLRAQEDAVRNLIKHTNATTVDSVAVLQYSLDDTWLPWKRRHIERCVAGFDKIRHDTYKYCEATFTIIEANRIAVWAELRKKYDLPDDTGYSINYHAPEIWVYKDQKDDIDKVERGET